MKIYIAGKISGLDEDVAARSFEAAAAFLVKAGHEPLNPMELVEKVEGREWAEYMLEDMAIILTMAEGVYMLANWRDSPGARIEHAVAVEMKMPIFYEASSLPVGCDRPERVAADFSL